MRKRSNTISGPASPLRGIEAIGARLKVINPYAGTNPRGRCYQSAIETAEVLTTLNRNPQKVEDDNPDDPTAKRPQVYDVSFAYENGRRTTEVWRWLKSGGVPAGAVFVVEEDGIVDGDDSYHCWNFVKGPDQIPSIYLIDSSTHVFKEVVNPADFSEWMTEYFTEPMEFFNYASPNGMVNDDLEVYYWGQLVQPWLGMLQRVPSGKAKEAPF